MVNSITIGYIVLLLFDLSIVPSLRVALFDCFRCNGYNKSYKKIHENQSVLNRITLNYISTFIKKYKNDFVIVHKCYKLYLVVSIIFFLLIVLLYFLYGKTVCLISIVACCFFKSIIALVIRIILFPHGDVSARSIFIERKKK